MTAMAHDKDALYTRTGWIVQRQAAFEHEVGLDPAACEPITNEQLNDVVYEDFLEEREASHAA